MKQNGRNHASKLEENIDLQDILSVNLERSVQLCVDIGTHIIAASEKEAPDTMGETFDMLSAMEIITPDTAQVMIKAVGFRNIAVHNYDAINWAIVFSICTEQLDDFRQFASGIDQYLSL